MKGPLTKSILSRDLIQKNFFRDLFKAKTFKNWDFGHSGLYLDFLAEINPTLVLHGVIQQETFLVGRNPVIFWEKDM